ncbi:Dedicator of cytokinesis protein isoform 4 [Schistosoma japonicum]|uniref:Dedicator of cytokinesis protein isoform 4 n=1 Tax=Schistosoma japonicum TaxID=6182 RepID=A0A4Z2CUK8_SCHJA|nr:Dedicator of cytokinesis protein isoform 4 [Schistosoma japonicum]
MSVGKRKFAQHIIPNSQPFKYKDGSSAGSSELPDQMWCSSISMPIDYEEYVAKNKALIVNDPHRETILFPQDDLKVIKIPHCHRVLSSAVPQAALKHNIFASNPLARHTVSFFATNEWNYIQQLSSIYRGNFHLLPFSNDIDELGGKLSQYWFSIDHSVSSKGSPSHTLDSSNFPTSTASKVRTSTGFQVRSRWSASSGLIRTGQTVSETATVDFQSKNNVKLDKINSDTALSRSGSKSKDMVRTDGEAVNDSTTSCLSFDGKLCGNENVSCGYLESQLVICNHEMYQQYIHLLEGFLSSGSDKITNNIKLLFKNHDTTKYYCLRQLQIEELSESDRQKHSIQLTNERMRNLTVGLHVIAPCDWRASKVYSSSYENENVIFLDTIESVRSIGDYWIRLEKILPSTYSASSMPLSSPTQHINQSLSIVNQSNELFTSNDQLLNDEIYLYFDPSMNDGLEKRQMWLKGIELALKLERHRRRMGYHHHQQRSHFCENSGPTKSNMLDLFRSSNDVGSVRSALQRYAQETELFVIRQRQKDRIKLMTLFPDVRIRQDKFKMCSPHENNTIITSVKDSLSPFPERSIELCSRRFLATCLGLHSKLQANFETTGVNVSSHLENPEPYFVTMFLVDVNNGRRVSEDFYWDPNSPIVDSMLPAEQFKVLPWLHETNDNHNQSSSQHSNTVSSPTRTRRHAPPPPNNNLISPYGTQCSVSLSCLHKCRTALFSMPSCCHVNQLYIVVRVDKVLSGPINTVVEKYLKNCYNSINDNIKIGSSIQKSMVNYCRNIGRYRMPFAWGASSVNSTSHFIHLFKMDPNKTSELGLIQSVQMFSRLSTDSNYNNSLPIYQDCNTYPQNTTATTINSNDSGSSMHESNRYHIPESINHLLKIESNQFKSLKPNNNPSVLKDFMSYMTEQDRVFVEMVERSLKTQMLPLRFELVINELIDQDVDPNAQILSRVISSNLETYTPVINATVNTIHNFYIPSTHPKLMSDEIIREVENLFDLYSTASGTSHNDDYGTDNSDDSNAPSRTGSLQRSGGYLVNSLNSNKNNRDSVLSNGSISSATGSLIVTNDLPKLINNTFQYQSNSLDRTDQSVVRLEHGTSVQSSTLKLLPFTSFSNTLYVCPKSLNLSGKHNFPRARNLSCFIELRSNDSLDNSTALKVFYTRPNNHQPIFDSWFNTSVMYHDTNPNFSENAKICLPLNLTAKHHLLFRFYHVSCETAATNLLSSKDKSNSNKKPVETSTGYSWMPILGTDGNLNVGTFQLRIAATIHPGYLQQSTIQNYRHSNQNTNGGTVLFSTANLNSNNTSNNNNINNSVDFNWIDNGKYLFKVNLKPFSSLYTHDPILSRFFRVCGDLLSRMLYLSPLKTMNTDKQKQNRVTFCDDTVVIQPNNVDVSSSSSKRISITNGISSSNSILHNATSIHLHICNAMKALLLISPTGLVQFLPIILNQFMEIIILSAEASARWFQQLQQQEQALQAPDSIDKDPSVNEYLWFKSLKNNFSNNTISTNTTIATTTTATITTSSNNSTPDDVLKTAVSTLTMLISELNAQIPNDSVYYPSKLMKDTSFLDGIISSNTSSGECVRHNLLKTYVEFVFNPDSLLTTCMNHYLNENHEITGDSTKLEEGIQQHELMLNKVTISPSLTKVTRKLSSQSIIGQYFPLSSLHHSIIRGLILILSDAHCPNHILMHLFNNIWFLLALIIKSMIQYLCISKKIWAERSGESRFSVLFCEDLTIFIQLIGSRLLSSSFGNSATNKLVACNQPSRNEELNTVHQVITSSNGLSSQPSGKYVNESLTPRNSLSSESVQHKQSTTSTKRNLLHTNTSNAINDAVDFNRIDFMSAIGQFLGQLFNIMDRGYVFKRVRDLLTFLEISPKMSVDKIDQLNELRFELLRCICEHEHFIQLNLPMLNMSDGLNGVELTLTDQFCQQHFIVGILLNQLSCLLSGCINTGSWAILKSTSTHQQYKLPITILRNLLIKHTLDPRYRNSKMIQARICSLYLPLIRLVLDNYESLGPPGGALQTAVVAAAVRRDYEESLLLSDGNSNSGTLNTSRRHRSTDKSSKFTKSNVMSHTIGHAGSASYRPQSMTSDYSFETISSINNQQQQNHHMNSDNGSYNSCLSRTSSSVGSNNPSFSQFIDRVSLSSDGQSTGNSAVESTTTSAAAAYLTKDGKVQKHILDQIAGVNQGGALERVHRLRQLDNSSISQTPRSTAVESSTGRNVLSSHNHCPRSQSIHSVDSTQSSCILSSHASSSTLTLTGLDMDNKNNIYYNQLNGKITHREDNDVDSDSDIDDITNDCKNDRIDRNHNEQNPDQDWAKQVLTLAGIYTDRVNDAKSVGSVKPHSGSTTSVEIPLDISVSEVESPLSDTFQQPPIYHHHLPTHQHHHRFNLQKVFIPELLLAKQPIIRPHIHRRPYELNNLDAPRRLTDNCQRDLYICLLHIMSTVTITHLKALLQSFTVQERLHFLNILRYSIQHLRYRGKHCIQQYEHISHSGVGRTGGSGHLLNISNTLVNNAGLRKRNKNWQNDLLSKSLLEDLPEDVSKLKVLLKANLATESSLIILDLLSTFSAVFKSELNTCKPCDPVFRSVLETYICILSNNPSDHVMRHTFSALRVFINQNAQVLFSESTDILSMLCLAGLRCSNQCFLSLSSFMSSLSDPSTATTTTCPMSNSTDSSINLTPDSKSSQTLFSVGAVSYDAIPDKSKLITVPKLKSLEMNDINQTLLTTNHTNNNNENDIDDNINQTLISRLCLDACGFLYRLWKCSFETHQQVGFHRVHLQTIIAISKLVTELSPGFEASLSLLHSLAQADMQRSSEVTTTKLLTTVTTASSSMKTTSGKLFWTDSNIRLFLDDIDDLIRRILTVLTATAEMRRHCDDPERIVDLQYALAKSYSSNPALRRTWLEELVKFHMNSRSFTELAMTKLHIAALMAEYLKRRGEFPQGCDAFKEISLNISLEESGLREDSTTLEISYTQDDLLTDINEAALALESAGLFECIRPVYALILPVYEFKCQYTNLAQIYHHIGRTYEAISRVESQGHRLFATYYRVTFYGQLFESMAGKSFIYRSNPCQKLNEKCNELLQLYRHKYGNQSVELLSENYINRSTLDPKKAYVQVTYVEPYKETKDSNKKPLTSYAKHHDIHQFMFETPFLRQPGLSTEACLLASGPKRSDDLTIQWKRRTILTTEATFPHIRRRLEIIHVTETDFTPIDSAVDAIQCKNQELMSHVITLRNNLAAYNHSGDSTGNGLNLTANTSTNLSATVTMTTTSNNNNSNSNANNVKVSMNQIPLLMDMQLQGALLPTVNAGPMAYAQAFLKVENQSQYPASKVNQLKELFFDFLSTCLILLTYYYNLMSNVHEAKYRAMREALDRYRVDLSNLLKEEIIIDEKLLRIGPKSSTSCSTTLSRL